MVERSVPQRITPSDPGASYRAHHSEIDEAILRVLAGGRYLLGEEVAALEAEFAAYCGTKHAVCVGSGTDALELALRAAGITVGSRVFTVSHTAVATVTAIVRTGATPVLVDIDPATYNIDTTLLADSLARFSACERDAIVPVHLYGQPAQMDLISVLGAGCGATVVEDCAQAHGARYHGQSAGSIGRAGAYSFYPTKNLGACGDGGAVVTNDDAVAQRVRMLGQYGWDSQRVSHDIGLNSRLDELQAAILRVKLRYLEASNRARRRIAQTYDELLEGGSPTIPLRLAGTHHVFHQYVIRVAGRDLLRAFLHENGVDCLVHYPLPVHLHPAFASMPHGGGGLARTEEAALGVLSLPIFPEMPLESAERVAELIVEWAGLDGE